jgi:hypothetical protein
MCKGLVGMTCRKVDSDQGQESSSDSGLGTGQIPGDQSWLGIACYMYVLYNL